MTLGQALQGDDVLLMDGAMGTEFLRAGVTGCLERANLERPELVAEIHRAYVQAGARVVLTNTFQANPESLGRHGLAEHGRKICQAAITLARSSGAEFVLGAIGPCPHSDIPCVVSWLEGVDALLFETWADPVLFDVLPATGDVPILASFAFLRGQEQEARTLEIARRAQSSGVLALGVNCGQEQTMSQVAQTLRRYRCACSLPLLARPNAGTPLEFRGDFFYPRTPEQMALEVNWLVEAGAKMIGGCCGTTPAHIAALQDALRGDAASR